MMQKLREMQETRRKPIARLLFADAAADGRPAGLLRGIRPRKAGEQNRLPCFYAGENASSNTAKAQRNCPPFSDGV